MHSSNEQSEHIFIYIFISKVIKIYFDPVTQIPASTNHVKSIVGVQYFAARVKKLLMLQQKHKSNIFIFSFTYNSSHSSQDLYLDLYTCMEYVLGHTRITRFDLFQDIFHTATAMLSCPTDQSKGKQHVFIEM